jgi:hypothetical protein
MKKFVIHREGDSFDFLRCSRTCLKNE